MMQFLYILSVTFFTEYSLCCALSISNRIKILFYRGAFHIGIGPLDAQNTLLDAMLHMVYDNVDISNAISVIESVTQLVYQHIVYQEKVLCKTTSEGGVLARSCFGGLFSGMLRPADSKVDSGDASRDSLMCNLLKLVYMLVQIGLPGRNNQGSSGGPRAITRRNTIGSTSNTVEMDTEASVGINELPTEDSPLPDSSKISQGFTGTGPVLTSTPNVLQSDDEKSIVTDEQKTENVAAAAHPGGGNRTRSCSHFTDSRNAEEERKDPSLSDIILAHPGIMHNLMLALSCCSSNAMAMILSSSGIPEVMLNSLTGIDPISVGDGVFQILCTLNRKTSDVKLMLKQVLQYMSSGFLGNRGIGISRLSEPLLWFILRVLDCETMIRHCLNMGMWFLS